MLNMQTVGETMIVSLDRDLDMVEAKNFKDTVDTFLLLNPQIKILQIDLADVSFIDSSGLGAIIGRYKNISLRQGSLVITNASDNVRRILEMAGLKKLLETKKTKKEVL